MDSIIDGGTLAQAIVDTVRESLLVLDGNLKVVAASRSFYSTFHTTPEETIGRKVYDLGSGEWNNTPLRELLERIVPERGVMDNFEVEQEFPDIGRRTMLLNARKVFYQGDLNTTLLLAIEDITDRRNAERLLETLSEQKDMLFSEMNHRVANSLQLVASILLLRARTVDSMETRGHLEDAYRRVMSVASLQQQLKVTGLGEEIHVGEYLKKLCETLSGSMIRERRPVSLIVSAGPGFVGSEQAVSLGLVVTELVINALKHAFPVDTAKGHIEVGYSVNGTKWSLSVTDNGVGMAKDAREKKSGLGSTLIDALAQKLEATVNTQSSAGGTKVLVEGSLEPVQRIS